MFLYAEQRGRRSINGTQMGPSSSVFVTSRCSVNPYRRWEMGRGERDNKLKAAELKVTTHQSWESGCRRWDEWERNYSRGEREREGAIKLEWESLGGGGGERREVQREESAHRERERVRGIKLQHSDLQWDRWVSAVCGVLPLYLVIEDHIKMVP